MKYSVFFESNIASAGFGLEAETKVKFNHLIEKVFSINFPRSHSWGVYRNLVDELFNYLTEKQLLMTLPNQHLKLMRLEMSRKVLTTNLTSELVQTIFFSLLTNKH